ncbi:MAG: DUF4112 domain-containing protein [Litorimonas sp.]
MTSSSFPPRPSAKPPLKSRQDVDMAAAPEIIPPHLRQALDELEESHALQWAQLNQLEAIARLMDAQFAVPFTPIRLGLDTLIGLVPGVGDTISFGVAGYIIFQAARLGVNSAQLLRMVFTSFVDWLIGLVPIIGDIFDIGWRSNLRNTTYLREIMETKWENERAALLRL